MSQDVAIIGPLLVEAPTQGRIVLDQTIDNARQVVLRFDNGWGLSIIKTRTSYGVEASVLYWQHDTPADQDYECDWEDRLVRPAGVRGWLDQDELRHMIADVMNRQPYRWAVKLAVTSSR